MVIDVKKTFIGYRCPSCGNGVISSVGVFSLGGDFLKLKCECGESELTIQKSQSGQIRLSVPCLLCPKPHNFTVNESLFFKKDEAFMIGCPYTNFDMCFIGSVEDVSAGLERTQIELLDMLGAEEVENILKSNGEKTDDVFTDPQIHDIIMFVIGDLAEEKKIFCKCDGGICEEYEVEVLDDGIRVYCKECGASQLIPTDSLLGAHAFLNCDKLNLE